MKKNNKTRDAIVLVVVVAIGSALYGVGGLIGIPIFANTTIKPAMAILGLIGALYGSLPALIVGFVGHLITDMLSGWGVWVTWAIGSAILGAILGMFKSITDDEIKNGVFGKKAWFTLGILSLVGNFIGYGSSAILDMIVAKEPSLKVFTQAILASITNIVVIIVIAGAILSLIASKFKDERNFEDA